MLKIHGKLFHILCTNMAFHQYGFFHVNVYVGLGGNIFHNGRNWRASLLYEFFDVFSRVFYEKMFFAFAALKRSFTCVLLCIVMSQSIWPGERLGTTRARKSLPFLSCEHEDVVGVMMHGQRTFHKQCTRMIWFVHVFFGGILVEPSRQIFPHVKNNQRVFLPVCRFLWLLKEFRWVKVFPHSKQCTMGKLQWGDGIRNLSLSRPF